eukprot:gene3768-65181_t
MFFLLFAVEMAALKAVGGKPYRLNDTLGSVSLGIMQQLFVMVLQVLGLNIGQLAYQYVWNRYRIAEVDADYNLPTALRQGMLQPVMVWVPSLPLALFFPPAAHMYHGQLNMLYQFWIHTELCGRLGPLEYVLNTPFHHRMHHRPPGNCNYAGVLIVWDRMFGTYSEEME